MGYELHIVRRNNWEDYEEYSNITIDEWLAYVHTDNELELTNGFMIKIPGVESSFQHVPGFCNWKAHSTKKGNDKPWFDYGHGMISTKYPDDETIRKMISIAERLQGRVQGDDGEFYDDAYFENRNAQSSTQATNISDKKPWWKFW